MPPSVAPSSDPKERSRRILQAAWIGVLGNLLIAGVKGGLGIVWDSIALIADAVHTLSDLLTSAMVIVGAKVGARPPDEEHPFGHGRAEDLAAFAISVVLGVIGVELAIRAIGKLFSPTPLEISLPWLFLVLLTGVLKEGMARYAEQAERLTGMRALGADAWHHRTDALSTLGVVLALYGARQEWPWLDGVAGLAVALFVLSIAYRLIRETGSHLLGRAPEEALVRAIIEEASRIPGVSHIHHVHVHYYGFHREITLHIHVEPSLPVREAHEIATEVEEQLRRRIGGDVTVHIEPLGDRGE